MITATVARLSPSLVLTQLTLLTANEQIKGLCWAWYLRANRLPIQLFGGLTSYLAAQVAIAVPGGALLSARLAEEHGNGQVRLRHTVPPLLVQAIGDLIAVSIIAIVGIAPAAASTIQFVAAMSGMPVAVLTVVAIRSECIGSSIAKPLGQRRITLRIVPAEEDGRRTLVTLFHPRALGPGIAASLLSDRRNESHCACRCDHASRARPTRGFFCP